MIAKNPGGPDLYVLGSASDLLALAVLAAAEKRGICAVLCSRAEYTGALTVSVRASGIRVTPDRPVLVRQHLGDEPKGQDSGFISAEVYAHVRAGLSLLRRTVINRPGVAGPSALLPPMMAIYHLRARGTVPAGVTFAPEAFCDRVYEPLPGWEMQDMHTLQSCLCSERTFRDTPQRLRRRQSPQFSYISVLAVGERTWPRQGEADPGAGKACGAAVQITSSLGLQLAEVTFKSVEGRDMMELAKIDANPLRSEPTPIIGPAADALIDLLIAP